MIKFWAIPEHLLHFCLTVKLGFPGGSDGKEFTCNGGNLGSIPGLGRSPGEWNGYPLQYSGLENSMDCIVHGITKSWIQLNDFHFTPTLGPCLSHNFKNSLSHLLCPQTLPPRPSPPAMLNGSLYKSTFALRSYQRSKHKDLYNNNNVCQTG